MAKHRFLRSVLTTEPDLDPPEFVDHRATARRRDQKQEMDYDAYWHDQEMYQEEINTWRMYDAADQMENSLLEMEGK